MVTVLSFSFAAGNAAGQIYPGEEIQGKMLVEEQAFLANMKEGLQHVQMLAVRDAMKGDYGALEEIRQSRNKAPVLPENIDINMLRPIFVCSRLPVVRLGRDRCCCICMAADGVSAASTVARVFVQHWRKPGIVVSRRSIIGSRLSSRSRLRWMIAGGHLNM